MCGNDIHADGMDEILVVERVNESAGRSYHLPTDSELVISIVIEFLFLNFL